MIFQQTTVPGAAMPRSMQLARRHQALLLIVLLAFALRINQLTFHSLELDEAVSIRLARATLPDLITNTINLRWDPHPPFYYSMLHVWMRLLGENDVVVKWLGVAASTLTPLIVFALAHRLSRSTAAGLLAALLAALAPLEVYNAQQVRMFALIPLLTGAAAYVLVRTFDMTQRRWFGWLIFVALNLAALYTHFSAIFILPFELILGTLLAWRRRQGRLLLALFVAFGLIGLGYLPYLSNAVRRSSADRYYLQEEAAPDRMVQETLRAFGLGQTPGYEVGYWTAAVLIGCVLTLGLAALVAQRKEHSAWLTTFLIALLGFAAPFAGLYVLDRLQNQPLFVVRYLLPAQVWLFVMLALSIVAAWHWRRALGLASVVVVIGLNLYGLTYNWKSGFQREDWQYAAAYLETHAAPNDVILIHPHFMGFPFERYYHGRASVEAPFGSQIRSVDQISSTLSTLIDHPTIWLVQSGAELGDPDHLIERWLADRFPLTTEQYPMRIAIKGYAAQIVSDSLPLEATPLEVTFGDGVRLLGYTIDQRRLRATDDRSHPPSNWIHLTLYWQMEQLPVGSFDIRAQLVDSLGQVWGAQLDRAEEIPRRFPPDQWPAGAVVRTEHDINLNPATPPGIYRVEVSTVETGSANTLRGVGRDAQNDRAGLGVVEIIP